MINIKKKSFNSKEPPKINKEIKQKKVRLINASGENLNVVPLDKALELARKAKLDLVEIAPNARPPICKIMAYAKKNSKPDKNPPVTLIKEKKTSMQKNKVSTPNNKTEEEAASTDNISEKKTSEDNAQNTAQEKTAQVKLIDYTIGHLLPGRVRFYINSLKRRPLIAQAFEREAENHKNIKSLTTNIITGSALVFYDQKQITPEEIIATLSKVQSAKAIKNNNNIICCPKKDNQESDLALPFLGIVATGVILAVSLVKVIFKRGPFSLPVVNKMASVTALVAGIPVFKEGITYMIEHKKLSLDFLVSMAAIMSIVMGEGLTALEVIWLMNCGTLLEEYTADKSRRAIHELIQLGEDEAWMLVDDVEVRIPLDQVPIDAVVCIHTGEKISVDGEIVSGEGSVNQASITGESIPVYKKAEDTVYAGTVLEEGYLQVKAAKVGDDTYLARVIHLVEESLETRAPIESIADQFAAKFVPFAFIFSIGVYVVTRDFYRAMTVLVTACPCAAAIATPTAVSAAIGNAARNNILVKGGRYLEEASRIDTLCLDKTGTLTAGKPTVETVINRTDTASVEDVLALAACAEMHYKHPLGLAIMAHAEKLGVATPEHKSCEMRTGKGILAVMEDCVTIAVGSHRLMTEIDIDVEKLNGEISELMDRGETVVYVAKDTQLIGAIGIRDNLRPEAKETIRQLRETGIKKIVLITGDNKRSAQAVSRMLDLDEYYYEMLPEEKAALIDKLSKAGAEVAMVGDGVNDALALSQSRLGIAMGAGGSELAVETADISLSRDNLEDILSLRRLSLHTMAIIKQNYTYSMAMNAVGITLGAGGIISPLTGGILHILNSIGVILNSSRLLRYKNGKSQIPITSKE